MLQIDKTILQDFEKATEREWLETNGLGGWAGASINGCNTRRYHGLLIAATAPPTERMNLLSRLDETIITDNDRYELACSQYRDTLIHPEGYQYLQDFSKDLFPQWTYEVDGIRLSKTIAMLHGENTTLIIYKVEKASLPFRLELLPLICAKGYHSLQHASANIRWDVTFDEGIFHNKPFDTSPDIYIAVPGATYLHQPEWFYHFNYAIDKYRGQEFEEDLFNHGRITTQLQQGDTIGIIISTGNPAGRDATALLAGEIRRRETLLAAVPAIQSHSELHRQLLLAADQFIVKRDFPSQRATIEGATVIAGYHWFTDWSRDTMISLAGLCLSTGRTEDAKKILRAFAANVSEGMLPNRFQDNNQPPEYNTVDGTLWYFIAIHQYLKATGDKDFVLAEILPVLKDIIDWHYRGTRYNIHVTADRLLNAGEKGQQLTWMDARVDDFVVTPRMGKPVEIQALWYNALKIFSNLLLLNNQSADAGRVIYNANTARESFTKLFWYEHGAYLYDVIAEDGNADPTLRPNQLFAISLPYPLVTGEQAKKILHAVEQQLFTPVGLKTLPANDPHYIGVYGGDVWHRDNSYHQGTVWAWLLGPYVDAMMRTDPDNGRLRVEQIINDFSHHLLEGCVGSVSEIMDGDAPHHPRGCAAQAWSVAEILRVLTTYLSTSPYANT